MPFDLLSESRLSLNQLAHEQGVALSTCWRWSLRGIRGHKLECLNIGGRKFTTREAFERFVTRTNGQKLPVSRTPRQREADQQRAEKEFDKLLA